MSFHLISTNGFYINVDKERFTDAGSRHFEVRVARAKRSVLLIQPIKELICGVTITIPNQSRGGC